RRGAVRTALRAASTRAWRDGDRALAHHLAAVGAARRHACDGAGAAGGGAGPAAGSDAAAVARRTGLGGRTRHGARAREPLSLRGGPRRRPAALPRWASAAGGAAFAHLRVAQVRPPPSRGA